MEVSRKDFMLILKNGIDTLHHAGYGESTIAIRLKAVREAHWNGEEITVAPEVKDAQKND